MKNLTFIIAFLFIGNLAIAQNGFKSECTKNYSCSQKYGMTTVPGNYILKVEFDDESIGYTTSKNDVRKDHIIAKKSNKYVIGKNSEGNYAFFDLKKKQVYSIDYFMNRYMTAGYGANSSDVEQTTLKMMKMLKNGDSQKAVIQYLVEQTEFDF